MGNKDWRRPLLIDAIGESLRLESGLSGFIAGIGLNVHTGEFG